MMDQMQREAVLGQSPYGLLGLGRLGGALHSALGSHGIPCAGVWNRSPKEGADGWGPLSAMAWRAGEAPRLFLLTVADAALPEVAQQLASSPWLRPGAVALHCAGQRDSSVLAPLAQRGCAVGSFHPLQPIAQDSGKSALFRGLYVGIEGAPEARDMAQAIVGLLEGKGFSLEGVDRDLYHAAAVIASNYAVTLASLAEECAQLAGLQEPLPLLLPLMQAAVDNLAQRGLPAALTGPISRADHQAIADHLQALEAQPHLASLYLQLAKATLPIAQAQGLQPHHRFSKLQRLIETHGHSED